MNVLAPKVLVVEDEGSQRAVLTYNLEAEGYSVSEAANGEEALLLVAESRPDVIVLDWMMPRLSGIELCRQLKARSDTRDIPVIMLSARSEEGDRVRGLDTGADDYMVKPYSINELMARVRMQLRRVRPAAAGQRLEHDGISVDTESRRVTADGAEVHLGPTEYRLLVTFLEKPGRVFSREQLLDRVWGDDVYVGTRTVDVHVGRLRKSLSGAGADDPIRTVRGAGYAIG